MEKSAYIAKAASRGHRPSQFASFGGYQRQRLVARLVSERQVARFIVAPDGFGKTSLAIEYAETMFAWTHVFWLNAESPCFIRDLDLGILVSSIVAVDAEARLVVMDGLPFLDAHRAQLLSDEIDALLGRDCEVIVTCVPSRDLLGGLQRDRLRLGATDLLLDDDELEAARTAEERARTPASQVPAARRVPALAWADGPDADSAFAAGCLREDVPADLLLVIASALVLGSGSFDDLASAGPAGLSALLDSLADYPHLGLDAEAERFAAAPLSVAALMRPVKARFGDMIGRSSLESPDELTRAWADALVAQGNGARACEVAQTLLPAKRRPAWIADHAGDLVRQACLLPSLRLLRKTAAGKSEGQMRPQGLEAVCRWLLGDAEGALRVARSCAFESSAAEGTRVVGLLLVARQGADEPRRRACDELGKRAEELAGEEASRLAWHDALTLAWKAREDGAGALAALWSKLRAADAGDDVLAVVASWLFDEAGAECEGRLGEVPLPSATALAEPERYVRRRVGESATAPDFLVMSAGLSMEAAHMKGLGLADGPLGTAALMELRRAEMLVLSQRRQLEQEASDARALDEDRALARSLARPAAAQRAVPTLELKMFGHFEVSIGGVPLDPALFKRKHARALLVLLASARGRELPRDTLAEEMWPASAPDVARRNFYTIWAQVRRALTLPDGRCPYLVRHEHGCRLDEKHVVSDVARLGEICRMLLFGQADQQGWCDLYTEIDRDFASDLMPAERDSALVIRARSDFKTKLVDALVAAALRLADAGDPQWASLFASCALEHDRTREDAYVALMRAQVANEQRTAAMMTYLKCRRVLADDLGIDPSPEVAAMYEKLLDGK